MAACIMSSRPDDIYHDKVMKMILIGDIMVITKRHQTHFNRLILPKDVAFSDVLLYFIAIKIKTFTTY